MKYNAKVFDDKVTNGDGDIVKWVNNMLNGSADGLEILQNAYGEDAIDASATITSQILVATLNNVVNDLQKQQNVIGVLSIMAVDSDILNQLITSAAMYGLTYGIHLAENSQ